MDEMLPPSNMQGVQINTAIIHVNQNKQKKMTNFPSRRMKRTILKNKSIYLEAFRMPTKQALFFQSQSGIQLTE